MKLAVIKLPRNKETIMRPVLTEGEVTWLKIMLRIEEMGKLMRPDLKRIKELGLEKPVYLNHNTPHYYFEWYNETKHEMGSVNNDREDDGYKPRKITIKKTYKNIKECNKDRGSTHPIQHLWAWDMLGFDVT